MTARPLEYHNSLIWVAAPIIFVDSASIEVCDVSCEKWLHSFARVLCKLRCGRKLYSTVVRHSETNILYSTWVDHWSLLSLLALCWKIDSFFRLLLGFTVTAARLAVNGCAVYNIGLMFFTVFTINSSKTVLRPLLMLLEKWCQKTAFLTINFPTGFFQAPVLIFTGYQNKKGNKKVVFTGRLLQGGVCSLYSIGETVQCIHSLLHVLDNVTNNTSPRTAACRPIAYVAYLLTTLA